MFYYTLTNGKETKVSKSTRILEKAKFRSNNHPSKLSLWVDDNFDKISIMIVPKNTYDKIYKSA